ncbi:MAG: sel1 repeat family protein [Verrucomicrobia bacterium]|nr:sel1 repeat family protein [Verrucomicrobiota bacterium]
MKRIYAILVLAICSFNLYGLEVTFGIRPSPIKYSTELKEKAEEGDSEAQVNLGWCYFDGLGIDKDYKKAASWFQKAADQNNPWGELNLAICFKEGKGVPKNLLKAFEYFSKTGKRKSSICSGSML